MGISYGFDFLPAVSGIEPGTAVWEARLLPLCYAVQQCLFSFKLIDSESKTQEEHLAFSRVTLRAP